MHFRKLLHPLCAENAPLLEILLKLGSFAKCKSGEPRHDLLRGYVLRPDHAALRAVKNKHSAFIAGCLFFRSHNFDRTPLKEINLRHEVPALFR